MNEFLIGVLSFGFTIIIYGGANAFYRVFPNPFTLPILTATIVIICLLLAFEIPYETYYVGAQWIDQLLGPAVVALAYPRYKQLNTLKKYMIPIGGGVVFGGVIGVSSGVLLAKWAGFKDTVIFSDTPKSVTTPIAMDIAREIGGAPSLAAVFVMIAGISGGVMGHTILKWCRIDHFLGQGVGMGCASHAIGTSVAMANDELEGAISTVAMSLSAIVVSVITQPLIWLLL